MGISWSFTHFWTEVRSLRVVVCLIKQVEHYTVIYIYNREFMERVIDN